jgi:hypothetical protein
VRDLRRVAAPENKDNNQQQEAPAPNPKNPDPKKSDNRQLQNRSNPNTSRDDGPPMLATFPAVMLVAMNQARLNRRTA